MNLDEIKAAIVPHLKDDASTSAPWEELLLEDDPGGRPFMRSHWVKRTVAPIANRFTTDDVFHEFIMHPFCLARNGKVWGTIYAGICRPCAVVFWGR